MTCEDSKEYLRIADNACNAEAYTEGAGNIRVNMGKMPRGIFSLSTYYEKE